MQRTKCRVFGCLFLAALSAVSAAQTPYFPPKTFHDQADADQFVDHWYSQQLRALEEPSLFAMAKNPSVTEYRFLWLRTFHHPVAIRLEIHADGTSTLNEKMADGAGGYKPGKLIKNVTIAVSAEKTQRFLQHLETAAFWTIPTKEDASGCDGSEWVIEGVRGGQYRLVQRWSPTKGPIHDLGSELAFDLGGLEIPPKEMY